MKKQINQVNYIRHLENFLSIVNAGDFLHFGHIALYVSLFRIWNINYFSNPFCPSRSEIMSHAGIKSKDAFYRNLKELCEFDLIRYYPSKSRYEHSYYCISTIEHLELGFKIYVWGLSNHTTLNKTTQSIIDFSDGNNPANKKILNNETKHKLFNGKGVLFLEKSLSINYEGNVKSLDPTTSNSDYNPLTDPQYASTTENHISLQHNNINHANHQNPQSRRTGLRPSGIQIDPEADYSIKL